MSDKPTTPNPLEALAAAPVLNLAIRQNNDLATPLVGLPGSNIWLPLSDLAAQLGVTDELRKVFDSADGNFIRSGHQRYWQQIANLLGKTLEVSVLPRGDSCEGEHLYTLTPWPTLEELAAMDTLNLIISRQNLAQTPIVYEIGGGECIWPLMSLVAQLKVSAAFEAVFGSTDNGYITCDDQVLWQQITDLLGKTFKVHLQESGGVGYAHFLYDMTPTPQPEV